MADDRYAEGMKVRRAVLGDDHVDCSLAAAKGNAFRETFQRLVTENAWGTAWIRPELDRRSRSLVTVALIAALNRPHELKLHLNGAFNNGITLEELQEVVIHVACYCGWPAALDTLRLLEEMAEAREAANP